MRPEDLKLELAALRSLILDYGIEVYVDVIDRETGLPQQASRMLPKIDRQIEAILLSAEVQWQDMLDDQ